MAPTLYYIYGQLCAKPAPRKHRDYDIEMWISSDRINYLFKIVEWQRTEEKKEIIVIIIIIRAFWDLLPVWPVSQPSRHQIVEFYSLLGIRTAGFWCLSRPPNIRPEYLGCIMAALRPTPALATTLTTKCLLFVLEFIGSVGFFDRKKISNQRTLIVNWIEAIDTCCLYVDRTAIVYRYTHLASKWLS